MVEGETSSKIVSKISLLLRVGVALGAPVGLTDGARLGVDDGARVGVDDGVLVGASVVGCCVVGLADGACD